MIENPFRWPNRNKFVIDTDSFFPNSPYYRVLIVNSPTNIYYSAQVGGISCQHPNQEGFVLPICLRDDIDDCGNGACWMEVYASEKEMLSDAHENSAQRKKVADFINDFLKNINYKNWDRTISLSFDYDNIHKLSEAWWPVLIDWVEVCPNTKDVIFSHKGNGILVGDNCD